MGKTKEYAMRAGLLYDAEELEFQRLSRDEQWQRLEELANEINNK